MIEENRIWIKGEHCRKKKRVCVEIINRNTSEELEQIIDFYLKNDYSIQNSQIEFDCGTVAGVYVFILREVEK